MNTSFSLDPGNTEGFDEFAGRRWIYPNNMEIRAYQKQAVEKALFHNAMIVLPTGFGKTFIAAVVMYNYYNWYPRGKIVFVAPTRPLVAQQITSCKAICGFSSAESIELTGLISKERRVSLWRSKRVFFATPQCIENDLKEGVAPATEIKCIVIDEAHRAQGNYAYVNILRLLNERNRNGFRVLALSATPGSDIEKVKQVMLNLYISDVMFRSESSLDLLQYRNQKATHAWTVQLTGLHKTVVDQFIAITKPSFQQLCSAGLTFGQNTVDKVKQFTLIRAMDQIGNNGGRLKYMACACSALSYQFKVLTVYGLRVFHNNMTEIMADNKNKTARTLLMGKPEVHKMLDSIANAFGDDLEINPEKIPKNDQMLSHPKIQICKDILMKHFQSLEEGKETRVMIFTTLRESVYDIVQSLRVLEPILKPVAFVGQGKGKTSSGGGGMRQREQIQVVEDFKNGKYNILVATCVAEEGLDIGEVDLLICYDTKASPISTTQRRGRTGRKRAGVVHTLLTAGYEEQSLKSSSSSRRQVEDQLHKRENYMDVRYRDAPRMIPTGINPVFFPQKIYAVEEPETTPKPKRKRRRLEKEETLKLSPKLKDPIKMKLKEDDCDIEWNPKEDLDEIESESKAEMDDIEWNPKEDLDDIGSEPRADVNDDVWEPKADDDDIEWDDDFILPPT